MELGRSCAGSRLALGTAQFGLDYGANNLRGRVPESETAQILACAEERGITVLDTAPVYGDSEAVLGRLLQGRSGLRIVSKLPACPITEAEGLLQASCRRLRVPALYGCLIHDFESYRKDRKILDELRRLKAQGLVKKIGFSLYRTSELELIEQRGDAFDLVQLPLNLLDRRFLPRLAALKLRGVEVHARSAFLQGLLLRDPALLSGRLLKARPVLERLHSLAAQQGLPAASLCLGFVLAQEQVDKVVIGVDGLAHLQENLSFAEQSKKAYQLSPELAALEIPDEEILIPSNWK
jgi:aryl-alcohol dehydrogenase-like predicted oxidoreductase